MTEIRIVDGNDVKRLKDRTLKLMSCPLTFPCGGIIKTVLKELDLWEEEGK